MDKKCPYAQLLRRALRTTAFLVPCCNNSIPHPSLPIQLTFFFVKLHFFSIFCYFPPPIERGILLYPPLNEPSENKRGTSAISHQVHYTHTPVFRFSNPTCVHGSSWVGLFQACWGAAGFPAWQSGLLAKLKSSCVRRAVGVVA